MLITSPNAVRLGNARLHDVDTIAIDRVAHLLAEEWSDGGPYAVFADVPRQRIALRIDRRITRPQTLPLPEFVPGFRGTFVCFVSPQGTHAQGAEISATVVVTGVKYQLESSPIRQILTLVAVAVAPENDPIAITPNSTVPPA